MPADIYNDGTYLARHPSLHTDDAGWKAQYIAQLLNRNDVHFSSYVDAGCGSGAIIHELSRMYPNASFHGCDVSAAAIDLAKKYETHNVQFSEQDLLVMKNTLYDVAALIDVVEHVDDYLGFLRSASSIAKWYVFHFPLDVTASKVIRNTLIEERREVAHLHYFMKDTVAATLVDTGFQVVDLCYTRKPLALVKSWQYRLAWLPRALFYRLNPDLCVRVMGGFALLVLAKGPNAAAP